MSGPFRVPDHDGILLYCTGRGTHDPAVVGLADGSWAPARRPSPAFTYRCGTCRRQWPLGARQMRALSGEAAGVRNQQRDLSLR